MTDLNFDEFWGEPIHVYDDSMALEDGVIVDVSKMCVLFKGKPINRMTAALWADFQPFILDFEGAEPWYRQLHSTFKTKLELVSGQHPPYKLPPGIWLMPNEVGGWTAMYPSDY